MKIADRLECPVTDKGCGRGIVDHEIVFVKDGIIEVHCP